MRVEPSKPRFTVQQTANGLSIITPAPRSWFTLLFLMVWLGGWTIGGISAISDVSRGGDGQAFLIFWLMGWALGEFYALAVVLWQIAGREELVVSSDRLVQRIWLGGLNRAREFTSAAISHVRVSPQLDVMWTNQMRWVPPLFGSGTGAIAFDYGAKTYRVGAGLDEAEGRLVVDQLRSYFPRLVESERAIA